MDETTMIDLQKRNLVPLDFVLTRRGDPDDIILGLDEVVALPAPPQFALKLRVWDRTEQRAFTIDLHALQVARPGDVEQHRREFGVFSIHDRVTPEEQAFLKKLGVMDPIADETTEL